MMHDTEARVRMVKKRALQKRRRREKRALWSLSALCLLLSVSLTGVMGAVTGSGRPAVLALYGAILLHEDAGGYVLVGVIAFAAAVVITALCVHMREKQRQRNNAEKAEGGKEG